METAGLVGFVMVPLAATVALLQSWLTHGRPDYGAFWIAYAAGPVVMIVLAITTSGPWRFSQLIIDTVFALSLIALLVGNNRFTGLPVPRAGVGVLAALAVVSGVIYIIAPRGPLAITTGTWLHLAGCAIALGALSAGLVERGRAARSELRGLRSPLVIGLVVATARFGVDTIVAFTDLDAIVVVRSITGLVFLAFVVFHAFSLAGLIQQRAYRTLVDTNQRLDRALYDRRMDRLVASLAHRFGTPVFALRALLPVIREQIASGDSASSAVCESLDHASAAADRLSRVAAQFRLLWSEDDGEEEQPIHVGSLFREISSLELSANGAAVKIDRDDGVSITGPYRRTLQLFAVVVDYLVELGVCGVERPLRVEVINAGDGARIELAGLPIDPAITRAMLAGEGVRLELESTVRGLTYARERLIELYCWRELVVPDGSEGSRLVIDIPSDSLAY